MIIIHSNTTLLRWVKLILKRWISFESWKKATASGFTIRPMAVKYPNLEKKRIKHGKYSSSAKKIALKSVTIWITRMLAISANFQCFLLPLRIISETLSFIVSIQLWRKKIDVNDHKKFPWLANVITAIFR